MKSLKFHHKQFFTSVKPKTQKSGKNDLIFEKREAYACLLNVYRTYTDCLLIAQMLKKKKKRDIKCPDFRKNDVHISFTDVLRMSYGGLTILY